MRRILLLSATALSAAACGGAHYPGHATVLGPIGKGPRGVWVFRPAGRPRNVVVFFHGQGGPAETNPEGHRPWIDHLVARGSIVIYPRWELDYEADPIPYVAAGVRVAVKRVPVAGLPVLALGYSRGGAVAIEYAAVSGLEGLPVPDRVLSVFPAGEGNERTPVDLRPLRHSTRLLMLLGDHDTVVDGAGARYLLGRLRVSRFPGDHVSLAVVRSHGGFVADHLAPFLTTQAARAAFWRPADRLLAGL